MTDNEEEVYRDVLPEGFELHWYVVKSVLGRGAFGVTYLAQDKNLDQLVAIKEYFPNDFSSRESGFTVHPTTNKNKEMYEWGLDRFIREARTLAKFKHANIVRVLSVFEHNNTAYMVMEYEQGEELSKIFKTKEHLSEQELLDIFLPVLNGLSLVHQAGFIHRDIKPSNIYIREDGSPVLIDFGAARQVSGAPTRALTSLVTYGYAPFEQYNESEEKQGPWTDIYALGASLHSGLTGKLPIDALARGASKLSTSIDPYEPLSLVLEGKFSASFLRAIDHALLFHANERPQDVMVWADMLSGKIDVPELPASMLKKPAPVEDENATVVVTKQPSVHHTGVAATEPDTSPPQAAAEQPPTSKQQPDIKRRYILAVVALLFVVGGAIFLMQGPDQPKTIQPDQITALLARADNARELGNFLEPQDESALQLYSQVVKLDPSNQVASQQVQGIIDRYSGGIRSDLSEGYFEKAEKNIQLLLAAEPTSPKLLQLYDDIKAAKQLQVASLLKQASDYLGRNRLVSPKDENALASFRRVLELEPNNQEAAQGIEKILSHYLIEAKKDLASNKLDSAQSSIENIELIDPHHPELKVLQRKLAAKQEEQKQQQKAKQQKINKLLAQAKQAFDAGKLITPSKKNAIYYYDQALKLDRRNKQAKSGIDSVKAQLQFKFHQLMTAKDYTAAEAHVKTIEKALPGSRFAKNMRAEWEKNKPPEKSNIQIVEEMIGSFKENLEGHNKRALEQMSEFQPNRKAFVDQLFSNYESFKLSISNVRYIGSEAKGMADIKITNLINIQRQPVQPGAWSQFAIEIKKNKTGTWKVFW